MSVYELDAAVAALIDPDTGEILDYEAFESLQLERENKIETVIRWYKNELSESKAIKAEREVLTAREKAANNRAERLKNHLVLLTAGQAFRCAVGAISYRASKAAETDEGFITWALTNNRKDLLSYKDPQPNKTAIKAALAAGEQIEHAAVVERQNIQIK